MKIRKIEFENFRNFKKHGEIKCSTDGKVTLIYGKNGDGKTTLQQLVQWVFYNEVKFNKTTTDRLYNLSFEAEQELHSKFEVMGRVDFVHENKEYSLTRTNTYQKELTESIKIREELYLNIMDEDNNWKRVDNAKEIIEKMLPSGLKDYFFFEGESMIADLRVKGQDSATKLRQSLYSMFDLDVLESAIGHIGRTDLKTTALGKLYILKGTVTSDSEINNLAANIEKAQNQKNNIELRILEAKKEKEEKKKIISSISEQIGGIKSKTEYERQRKEKQDEQKIFLNNIKIHKAQIGETFAEMFPILLVSKAMEDAKDKLDIKISSTQVPKGLEKRLVEFLISDENTECICGRELSNEDKNHIKKYLNMFLPNSYTKIYNDFVSNLEDSNHSYNPDILNNLMQLILDNEERAEKCDKIIQELDKQEKNSPDIEDLVVERQELESAIYELDAKIVDLTSEQKKFDIYLKKQMKEYDDATSCNVQSQAVENKINIMKQVLEIFEKRLAQESNLYSEKLECNIQELLNKMLTSKRKVSVSKDFSVRVTDSYNDESKSEGQFAVVSFAYIGGILNMLRSEESLASKEYPLVLDGPFSKLDPDQRQNVVNMVTEFAPQVILFSKDDLHTVFNPNVIGRVWTITSNGEKNIAEIQEGYLWN